VLALPPTGEARRQPVEHRHDLGPALLGRTPKRVKGGAPLAARLDRPSRTLSARLRDLRATLGSGRRAGDRFTGSSCP
jgi:hypothetical protein